MMLLVNNLEVLVEKQVQDSEGKYNTETKACTESLKDALQTFTSAAKDTKNIKAHVKVLTFHSIGKHFSYQIPSRFEPMVTMSQIIGIELILDEKNTYTVYLDGTAKLLATTNRMITVLGAQALKFVAGGTPQVAYMTDDYWAGLEEAKKSDNPNKALTELDLKFSKERKERMHFLTVKRVFNYDEEKQIQEERAEKEEKAKRGRPKKDTRVKAVFPEIVSNSVHRVIIPDGSLVICDRVFVK